jgi:hypothetical protein
VSAGCVNESTGGDGGGFFCRRVLSLGAAGEAGVNGKGFSLLSTHVFAVILACSPIGTSTWRGLGVLLLVGALGDPDGCNSEAEAMESVFRLSRLTRKL